MHWKAQVGPSKTPMGTEGPPAAWRCWDSPSQGPTSAPPSRSKKHGFHASPASTKHALEWPQALSLKQPLHHLLTNDCVTQPICSQVLGASTSDGSEPNCALLLSAWFLRHISKSLLLCESFFVPTRDSRPLSLFNSVYSNCTWIYSSFIEKLFLKRPEIPHCLLRYEGTLLPHLQGCVPWTFQQRKCNQGSLQLFTLEAQWMLYFIHTWAQSRTCQKGLRPSLKSGCLELTCRRPRLWLCYLCPPKSLWIT